MNLCISLFGACLHLLLSFPPTQLAMHGLGPGGAAGSPSPALTPSESTLGPVRAFGYTPWWGFNLPLCSGQPSGGFYGLNPVGASEAHPGRALMCLQWGQPSGGFYGLNPVGAYHKRTRGGHPVSGPLRVGHMGASTGSPVGDFVAGGGHTTQGKEDM